MDKKQISFRVDPKTIKTLKFLTLKQDKTLTDLFFGSHLGLSQEV